MKLKEITSYLENLAPLSLQESYDNAGLIVGNTNDEISSVLIALDVTEEVIDEAIAKNAELIVSHHPIVFAGLKKFTGANYVERCVIKAIKNNISIYAAHTNLDSVRGGVNDKICDKLKLKDCTILQPASGLLKKLVCYLPIDHSDQIRKAIFSAGAGNIGNYDSCGYTSMGEGSFRGNSKSSPYVGKQGEIHSENEIRFETVFPSYLQGKIINTLIRVHPYEEVAYDIYSIENKLHNVGMGMIGNLAEPISEEKFLTQLKSTFNTGIIKHTALKNTDVRKVAVCGGSGSFLLKQAIRAGADFFVSGDFKYHQFFDAENKIVVADVGHFESEQFTKELFYELLTKKFPKFAIHLSEANTNPVFYF